MLLYICTFVVTEKEETGNIWTNVSKNTKMCMMRWQKNRKYIIRAIKSNASTIVIGGKSMPAFKKLLAIQLGVHEILYLL